MALSVEIEKHSGFCGGVIRAIGRAEKFLDSNPGKKLYSLGAIVHNEAELSRLGARGLVTIGHEDIGNIPEPDEETLLIRAHGEPPETYELARKTGIDVIDCTCPVVLKLQKDIRDALSKLNRQAKGVGARPCHPRHVRGFRSGPRAYSGAEGGRRSAVWTCLRRKDYHFSGRSVTRKYWGCWDRSEATPWLLRTWACSYPPLKKEKSGQTFRWRSSPRLRKVPLNIQRSALSSLKRLKPD